jgi:hypothetical protein
MTDQSLMTALSLPSDVLYPCTILHLLVPSSKADGAAGANFKQTSPQVTRTTPLLTYSFDRPVPAIASKGKARETERTVRTLEAPFEGVVSEFLCREGSILHHKYARALALSYILMVCPGSPSSRLVYAGPRCCI